MLSVIGSAAVWQFSANSVVVNQEDPADRLFFLLRGEAKYVVYTRGGRKLVLMWLRPGEIFGGAALLEEPSPYLCGVEVKRATQILAWERQTIRALASQFPRLWENALSIGSDYLTWYVATHVALTCHSARQRLAEVLLNLASGNGRLVEGGISLSITNEELANASNVTLFTASRLMAQWHRRGAIAKRRGTVLLRHPELLVCADESSHP